MNRTVVRIRICDMSHILEITYTSPITNRLLSGIAFRSADLAAVTFENTNNAVFTMNNGTTETFYMENGEPNEQKQHSFCLYVAHKLMSNTFYVGFNFIVNLKTASCISLSHRDGIYVHFTSNTKSWVVLIRILDPEQQITAYHSLVEEWTKEQAQQ